MMYILSKYSVFHVHIPTDGEWNQDDGTKSLSPCSLSSPEVSGIEQEKHARIFI